MSSISAVSAGIVMHAPPPAAAKGAKAGGAKAGGAKPGGAKPDGDGDHGVEPATTAQAQSSAANSGSSGVLNRTA